MHDFPRRGAANRNSCGMAGHAPLLHPDKSLSKPVSDSVLNKLLWRVVPLCALVAFCNYLNRLAISQVASEFCKDVGISPAAYGRGAGLFYITYIIFQIPGSYYQRRVGAPTWFLIMMVGWALVSSAFAFVKNEQTFIILRLLLGLFQSNTYPGMWYHVSSFFPVRATAVPLAIFGLGNQLALSLGGPIAAGILSMDGVGGWHGWQWVFFLEGIPTIIVGVAVFTFLPANVTTVEFLSDDDKTSILAEHRNEDQERTVSFWQELKIVLASLPLWWFTLAGVLAGIPAYIGQYYTTLYIGDLLGGKALEGGGSETGDAPTHARLAAALSLLPFLVTSVVNVLVSWSSKVCQELKMHFIAPQLFGAAASLLLALLPAVTAVTGVALLTVVCIGVGATSVGFALLVSMLPGEARATGLAFFNAVGNVCGLIGPPVAGLLIEATDSYKPSLLFGGVLIAVSASMILCLRDRVSEAARKKPPVSEERNRDSEEPIML